LNSELSEEMTVQTMFVNNNNTQFVECHGAIALEALVDRSSQLTRNRTER